MAAITVRNLTPETHRALKARAAANQRSTEAEVREILNTAVKRPDRTGVGSLLASIGQAADHPDLDTSRNQTPSEPVDLT